MSNGPDDGRIVDDPEPLGATAGGTERMEYRDGFFHYWKEGGVNFDRGPDLEVRGQSPISLEDARCNYYHRVGQILWRRANNPQPRPAPGPQPEAGSSG